MTTCSCCLCGTAVYSPMTVITKWGLSPNVCTDCLPEVNACIEPPRYLLVTEESFKSAQDLKNCCESAMKMNQKEENHSER